MYSVAVWLGGRVTLGRRGGVTAMAVGVPGVLASAYVVVRFLAAYGRNDLGWRPQMPPGEFYGVIGRTFTEGFLGGFALCLFLFLAGAGLEAWSASRRSGTGS
jgi:hypothetical protein